MKRGMRAKRWIPFALIVPLLAACVTEPQPASPPQAAAQASVPVPSGPTVPVKNISLGLVMSPDARATLARLEGGADAVRSMGIFANRGAIEDADPAQITNDLMHALAQRFRTVRPAATAAEAADRGDDAVLTIDLGTQIGNTSGQTTTVDLAGTMAGSDGQPVATLQGHGQGVVPYPAFSMGFRNAWRGALTAFLGRLDTSTEVAALAEGGGRTFGRGGGGARVAKAAASGPPAGFTLGLVLGKSTDATTALLRARLESMHGLEMFDNASSVEDTRPEQVTDDLVRELGQHFRAVRLADTAAHAAERGDGGVLTVDVVTRFGPRSGGITTVSISGRIAGPDGETVATAEGHGQAPIPFPPLTVGFRVAWRAALAEFVGKLTADPEVAALASGGGRTFGRGGGGARVAKATAGFPTRPVALKFARAPERPDDVAVIIGNADYSRQGKDIPDVKPAYADAAGAMEYAMQALGVREGNVIYLRDATGAQMTRVFGSERDSHGQLFDWVKPGKSRVFVYYAGHGASGGQGTSYLVPVDADGARVELNGYPLETLYRNLGQLPATRVTVVLEACFSGLSEAGAVLPKASGLYVRPRIPNVPASLTVIAAGAADQVASWDQDGAHSLFTTYFLEGMAGAADAKPSGNGDGRISLPEIKAYLDDTLTYYARRYYGRDQKAEIVTGGHLMN